MAELKSPEARQGNKMVGVFIRKRKVHKFGKLEEKHGEGSSNEEKQGYFGYKEKIIVQQRRKPVQLKKKTQQLKKRKREHQVNVDYIF